MAHSKEANHRVAMSLRKKLIGTTTPVKAIADSVGASESAVYDWCQNRSAVPAYAIGPLFEATNDPVFINELLGGSIYGFRVEREELPAATGSAISLDVIRVQMAAGDLAAAVVKAETDALELEKLEKAASDLVRALQKVLAKARAR